MTQWKAVYRNKKRREEDERWACTGCGSILDQDHHHTPKDGTCTCGQDHGKNVSNAFRQGYDQIDWSKDQSPGKWEETGRPGVRRFVLK